jgi:hypothetical protein
VDVDELRSTLDNAQREAFQMTTGSADFSCTEHGDTTRCVFAASMTLDLDALMALIGMESSDPSDVLITAEIYGSKGQGNGGFPGARGYVRTTWSWEEFQKKDSSPDLYLYAGEKPSCNSCGGSFSMVLFAPVMDISDPSDITEVFGIAGGSGGGAEEVLALAEAVMVAVVVSRSQPTQRQFMRPVRLAPGDRAAPEVAVMSPELVERVTITAIGLHAAQVVSEGSAASCRTTRKRTVPAGGYPTCAYCAEVSLAFKARRGAYSLGHLRKRPPPAVWATRNCLSARRYSGSL